MTQGWGRRGLPWQVASECVDGLSDLGAAWPVISCIRRSSGLVQRYEKTRPGELVHVDLKYLPSLENRAEFEFAAVDDFTREAVVWIAAARTAHNATLFLEHLVATLPYPIEAVMTDNDLVFTMRFAYYRQRRTRFEQACQSLGIHHRLLRPHAPETNGKVERFIKTIDDECLVQASPHELSRAHRRSSLTSSGTTTTTASSELGRATPIQRRDAYFAQVRLLS